MDIVPSQTLYINNINEKIKKDVLKKMFYMLFSQYGKVVQIVARKGIKLRGQAWVVFQEVSSATNALRGKQGFNFFGKPLKIQFAKEKSDVIARKEGAVVPREKRKRDDGAESADESGSKVASSVPNKSLLCYDLPADFTDQMLTMLFSQCSGFEGVRVPPGNRGFAFIDFGDEVQAGIALKQLGGFQLNSEATLNLRYSN